MKGDGDEWGLQVVNFFLPDSSSPDHRSISLNLLSSAVAALNAHHEGERMGRRRTSRRTETARNTHSLENGGRGGRQTASDSLFAVDTEFGINLVLESREEMDGEVMIRAVVIETTGMYEGLDGDPGIHGEHLLRSFQPPSTAACHFHVPV